MNVEATLKRRCAMLKKGCIDVLQTFFTAVLVLDTDVESKLCNVENPTLDIVLFSTSINVISTAIHNVETKSIQR